MSQSSAQGRQEKLRQRLTRMVQAEVQAVLVSLPGQLRERAETIPVTCESVPNPGMGEEGIEPDTLGLFVGIPFPSTESGLHDLPAQIILFLDNLWDYADGNEKAFRQEVRTTYLHELGHYLGLDEDDLGLRNLD